MSENKIVKIALPKGRMEQEVFNLLADAGIKVSLGARAYRPQLSMSGLEAKIFKPRNVIEMLHHGKRDLGFAGADWVAELAADLVQVLDTGLNPVKIVAAAPKSILENGKLPKRKLIVASEYENLTKKWIKEQGLDAEFVRVHGATEVFPPEDADVIVDNTATGQTLRANGLEIVDTLMTSSTRIYANPEALKFVEKKQIVDDFVLLVQSVLAARERVMLEVNVEDKYLEKLVSILPCMREPTVSKLHHGSAYALRAAVKRSELSSLIPKIKEAGGTDIVVSSITQIVP